MLLLTFLTVGASNCQSTKDLPKLPVHDLYQVIVEQKFCDENGENCEIKSICKQWSVNQKGEWTLIENHPLKVCHGKFGLHSDAIADYFDYYRNMKSWIKRNCNGTTANGQPQTSN